MNEEQAWSQASHLMSDFINTFFIEAIVLAVCLITLAKCRDLYNKRTSKRI
jgi:hypothetical protein